jgi:protein-S-isoprenylcysteine O-methyltransferase Ste14
MGPHWFHHHPIMQSIWIATYALWMVPETILGQRLRSTADAHKADRGSKLIVIFSVYAGIAAGFIASSAFPRFAMEAHWELMFALGIAIWLGGIAFRLYSIRVLGRFFTYDVAITSGQHVVEAGPYRWVRHPSYVGALLALLGFGMTMTNWVAVVLPVCCGAFGYLYRIPIEERALTRGLGEPYMEYMKRTWRLVPYVF